MKGGCGRCVTVVWMDTPKSDEERWGVQCATVLYLVPSPPLHEIQFIEVSSASIDSSIPLFAASCCSLLVSRDRNCLLVAILVVQPTVLDVKPELFSD